MKRRHAIKLMSAIIGSTALRLNDKPNEDQETKTLTGGTKWVGCVQGYDGKIYSMSHSSTGIIIIDPTDDVEHSTNLQ